MFLIHTLPQQIWTILMLSVSAFALWRGGAPERIVAVANVVASVASGVLENRQDWLSPQWADLGVDIAFLVLLLWLALRTDRHWPMWAAAFQVLGVLTYIARMADYRVGALAPFEAGEIWSYLILASLAVGTWLHLRRRLA